MRAEEPDEAFREYKTARDQAYRRTIFCALDQKMGMRPILNLFAAAPDPLPVRLFLTRCKNGGVRTFVGSTSDTPATRPVSRNEVHEQRLSEMIDEFAQDTNRKELRQKLVLPETGIIQAGLIGVRGLAQIGWQGRRRQLLQGLERQSKLPLIEVQLLRKALHSASPVAN